MTGRLKFFIKFLGLAGVNFLLILIVLFIVSTKTTIPPKELPSLRIACANVNYRNQYLEELCTQLYKLDADILIINEWSGNNPAPDSLSGMKMLFGEIGEKHGTAVFANEMIREMIHAESFYTSIQENQNCRDPMAAIRFSSDSFVMSIIGVHVPPPHLKKCRKFREPSLDELVNFVSNGQAKNTINIIQKNDPLIIMGDFNSLKTDTKVQEFLKKGLIDVVSEHVKGYCPTWPTRVPHFKSLYFMPLVPVIRIDHIFASKSFNTKNAGCFKIPGSDHRGLFLDIGYP
ncbi:endonuclease/exonuclease/phosphatase family protein [candidate division KSB1 bacterium]|nr:endonuclease/exonuclease/phosphatase family protein [candidate division KSB1 bacterium]